MKMLCTCSKLVLPIALFGAAGAAAQPTTPEKFGTPDNLPPPMEDDCDMTSGAAHGLCVAYCEAMDCDSDEPRASDQECSKVGNKFFNATQQRPPCERTCPCWADDDLNSVTAANHSGFNSCPGVAITDLIQNDGSTPGVEGGFAADPSGTFVDPSCFTRDRPPFSMAVSAEVAQVCADQIFDRCAAIGSPY
jgi:hypothetical protein